MSNHLAQIYSTTKNAEKYIVLNSQNVELSGNVKLTNGNLEVSNNLIFNTFSVGDKINFKETSNSTSYNIINDNLKSNNDASFNNVELSGNVYINGGLAIDNSFGISGEALISQGSTSAPKWVSTVTDVSNLDASSVSLIELSNNTLFYTPPKVITDVSNLDASSVSLIELSNNTLFYTPTDISGYQLQLDVLQNAPSGTGSLTLINNPTGGTLNRLSYTPPLVTGSTKRYASSSINQAISSGQVGLSAFNNFASNGITSTPLIPFRIQSGGAGYYQLSFFLQSTASTQFEWNYMRIFKNYSLFQQSQYYTPGVTFSRYYPHGGSFIIYLGVNDFIDFEAWASASHTITGYVSLNLIS